MKRKLFFHFILISLFSLSACAQTEEWYGTYTYEASLGENTAEDQMIIQYSFILTKDKCLITSQGYQTDEKIICTTKQSGKDLLVKFKTFGDGSIENIYGVEVYKVDGILFKLTSEDGKFKTTWGELVPEESLSVGEYFLKKDHKK
ncbi:MAG: hypothetical protein B0W54_18265 [Cellvibrio sp. 79]|nr:MAG: hypothetical protein B0W54_18265 [Cellvibrio sp. 79]